MNEPFTLGQLNPDRTRVMAVAGGEFIVSAQSSSYDAWTVKLQLKANYFTHLLVSGGLTQN